MGTIKTTNIEPITGSGTLTLGQSGETITIPVMLTTIQSADADDYFQAYTYQNSGTSQNYVGGSQLNEFGGYRIIE
jgi:hypothetical protein